VLAALVVVAALVGVTAYVVNGRVRRGEEQALTQCVTGAQLAVDEAYGRVVAMYHYVRPALDNGASLMVRRGLYELLGRAATGEAPAVAEARDECAVVHISPLHPDLRDRRDRCVRLLDEHVDFLGRAATDGVTLSGPWPRTVEIC
jgi:hypothetical protein